MYRSVFSIILALFAVACGLFTGTADAKTRRKSAAKKPVSAAASQPTRSKSGKKASTRGKSAHGSKVAASKPSAKTRGAVTSSSRRRGGRGRTAAAPRRSYQQSPTPDRYKEIQQALASRGYFQGEVNGVWRPDSTEALRRFQREQNLNDTGKIDSVSLIALGLGPKRNLSARTAPNPESGGSDSNQRPQDDNRRSEGSERP